MVQPNVHTHTPSFSKQKLDYTSPVRLHLDYCQFLMNYFIVSDTVFYNSGVARSMEFWSKRVGLKPWFCHLLV